MICRTHFLSASVKSLMLVMLLLAGVSGYTQGIRKIKAEWIQELKKNKSDTVYVINFWATWCKPCIEELPYFEQINREYKDKKVKVILVSNDFKKQYDAKLVPFVKEKNLQSEVVFMDETDANSWINKVNPEWSGAIPATLIICGAKTYTHFSEGETTFKELEELIKPLINE